MPSIFESATSSEAVLVVVTPPHAQLINYQAPGSLRAGLTVTVTVTLKNDGGAGTLFVELWDEGTIPETFIARQSLAYAANEQKPITLTFTMPPKDLMVGLIYGHMVNSTSIVDGSEGFTILLSIPTALNLALSPTQVSPGATVNFSGRLYRTDTGGGLIGKTIELQKKIDSMLGTVTTVATGSDGIYGGTFTAPLEPGTYRYRAYFAGGPGGSIFEVVVSNESSVQVGKGGLPWLLPAVGITTIVVISLWAITRRRAAVTVVR